MKPNPFQRKKWLIDGGLATELEKRDFDLNHPMWSAKVLVENARAIYDVHREYLAAGAEVLLTASYQATRDGFVKHFGMYEKEAREALYFMVELACRVRADFLEEQKTKSAELPEILIGASVGPYGATLADGSEYGGGYDLQNPAVGDYYAQKIEILVLPRKETRADFLAFETVPTAKESELIQVVLKGISWARAWITFNNPDELLKALPRLNDNDQIWAVGLNCLSIEKIEAALPAILNAAKKPIVLYPNGGAMFDPVKKTWGQVGATVDWQAVGERWWQSGVQGVGGCCQVGPAEIIELSQAARQA